MRKTYDIRAPFINIFMEAPVTLNTVFRINTCLRCLDMLPKNICWKQIQKNGQGRKIIVMKESIKQSFHCVYKYCC